MKRRPVHCQPVLRPCWLSMPERRLRENHDPSRADRLPSGIESPSAPDWPLTEPPAHDPARFFQREKSDNELFGSLLLQEPEKSSGQRSGSDEGEVPGFEDCEPLLHRAEPALHRYPRRWLESSIRPTEVVQILTMIFPSSGFHSPLAAGSRRPFEYRLHESIRRPASTSDLRREESGRSLRWAYCILSPDRPLA